MSNQSRPYRYITAIIATLLAFSVPAFCDKEPPAEQSQSSDTVSAESNNNADETSPQSEDGSVSEANQPPQAADKSKDADENGDSMVPHKADIAELYGYWEHIFNPQLICQNGDVDYATLRRKRTHLINAARKLENLHPAVLMSLSKEERIAFWINTHNTCVLKLIVDNYPIQPKWYMILYPANSIMHISGAWDKVFFKIMGLEYNLKEIRNDLLLDRYKDPRICFALSDAARGGAVLRNEPYWPERLDSQLDEQTRTYLQLPQGFRLDRNANVAYLSNVFTMNKNVFLISEYASILKFRSRKPDERAWLNFLSVFLPEEDAIYLENNDLVIRFIGFDWTLNENP